MTIELLLGGSPPDRCSMNVRLLTIYALSFYLGFLNILRKSRQLNKDFLRNLEIGVF